MFLIETPEGRKPTKLQPGDTITVRVQIGDIQVLRDGQRIIPNITNDSDDRILFELLRGEQYEWLMICHLIASAAGCGGKPIKNDSEKIVMELTAPDVNLA